jgi:hypothetical protein
LTQIPFIDIIPKSRGREGGIKDVIKGYMSSIRR